VIGLILQAQSIPPVHAAEQTIMVSLITPAKVMAIAPPEPPKLQPKAKPKAVAKPRPKPETPQLLSSQSPAPTPFVAPPPPEPKPEPVHEAPAPAPTPAPAPAPIVPPRLDASYLRNPSPVYPRPSRDMGEQGRVMLRVLVSTDGAAEKVEVDQSSGYERLDRSALDAVRKWKFVPARQGNTPIAQWYRVPVQFSLES
jgi:protein TonB